MTTVADASYVPADEWAQWERDRETRNGKHARQTSSSELDRILEALRARGIDYRCREMPGEWIAGCPVCAVPMNLNPETVLDIGSRLRITESSSGRVLLHCRAGHDPALVRHVLLCDDHCWHCGSVHGETEALCRRVAQLEQILDQALRVHQALGRGNDERVA